MQGEKKLQAISRSQDRLPRPVREHTEGQVGVGVGLGCEVIRFDEEPGSGVTAYFRCAWISISRRSWCSTPSFSI